MKKIVTTYNWYVILAICCTLFVACEPSAIDNTSNDKNAINFGGRKNAYVSDLPNVNAMLWGYYINDDETNWVFGSEEDNAMLGVDSYVYQKEITENGETTTEWVIDIKSPTRYWTDGKYDFFSLYCPDGGTIPAMTRLESSSTFTYDITSQKELLCATAMGIEGTPTGIDTEKVPFTYNHLLSKIRFKGFSKDANKEVTLTGLTVKSFYTTATYTINTDGTVDCDPSTPTKTISLFETKTLTNSEGTIVAEELIFPRTIDADDISFQVRYKVGDGEKDSEVANLPATTWEAGQIYTYTFYIQPSGPIIFGDITITGWGESVDAGELSFKN